MSCGDNQRSLFDLPNGHVTKRDSMLEAWTPNRIKWSLRKALLPIQADDLVLEVGSGSNPHPAADVLLEKYINHTHRYAPLVADRPIVLADACRMPFGNKVFDFVIAFHVLEHVRDPAGFLNELQRVAKAGYIETPNVLFERLVPYDVHLLEVMDSNGTLWIKRKTSARPDRFLNELNLVSQSAHWRKLFYGNPDLFHVRYFWKNNIQYKILNPEESCDWFQEPVVEVPAKDNFDQRERISSLRSLGLSLLRRWYRFKKTSNVPLEKVLACPQCHGKLEVTSAVYSCESCNLQYAKDPLPDFNTSRSSKQC